MMLLIYLIYLLLTTTSGVQLLYVIAQPYIPGKLTISQIEGSFVSHIKISNIAYSYNSIQLSLQDFYFSWGPLASLKEGKLVVKSISINKLCINYKDVNKFSPASRKANTVDLAPLKYLKYIDLRKLLFTDIDLLINDQRISVKSLLFNRNQHEYAVNKLFAVINNLPIHADVWLIIQNNNILPSKANIIVGKNTATLDHGRLRVAIPSLQAFHPKLNGRLDLQGDLQFNDLQPILSTDFYSKKITYGQQKIKLIKGHIFADINNKLLKLTNTSLFIPALGLTIKNLTTTAIIRNQIIFDGKITAGNGIASFAGSTTKFAIFPINLKISGNHLTVINLEKYKLILSPNLNIIVNNNYADIRGNIDIPYLKFTPEYLNTMVELPEEAIVIRDNDQGISTPNFGLTCNLHINLGKEIFISTSGLSAELAGSLHVNKSLSSTPTANGILHITAGQYKLYNQFLTIKNGRLLFLGNLITDPGLNIKVKKKITYSNPQSNEHTDNAYVGADVKGTLLNPNIELISNPPMRQDEILSYLIFTNPFQPGADKSSLLSAAASGLSMIAPSEGGNTSPFSLLAPLSNSLLSPGKFLNLKRNLTPSLYISTSTTFEETAIDLTYQYERD